MTLNQAQQKTLLTKPPRNRKPCSECLTVLEMVELKLPVVGTEEYKKQQRENEIDVDLSKPEENQKDRTNKVSEETIVI